MSNRKVSTDALETLGTIIDETQKRDAIHLAVLPVIAGQRLEPGDDVAVVDGKAFSDDPETGDPLPHTGIVDPFLKRNVKKGERFWMVLYPRMVTSLRHVWSHPAFEDDEIATTNKSESVAWVTNFAKQYDMTCNEMLLAGEDYLNHSNYITGGSEMEGEYVPDEFWTHYEVITGKNVSDDERGSFFSCSC